ncbi:MAG: NADH-quinone oxidoreductase subunit NuoH [Actinomycetes bacterium]|jgi:NADH-quinone oxidoreductase subunit H|nr:NADH-quinone oxidoreductase subunit NuoH [Actinomycetes bacterium]
MAMWLKALLFALVGIVVMLVNGAFIIYMLRKVLGHAHLRLGPTELGPAGLAQLIPDILKLLTKEDRHPNQTDKWLYCLAPIIVFVPSLTAFAFIPYGEKLVAANPNLGLLMMIAFLSVVPIGIFAAGWASRNKYALIGAMRSVGGAISYEIPLLLAALAPVMLSGSANLSDIVHAQAGGIWYILPCLPSAVIFFLCAQMETNQTPFDMAEAEGELVAGFSTEYSAMRFGFMYLSEFAGNFTMAALIATLFLGGWTLPGVDPATMGVFGPVVLVLKTYLVIFCFMMVRGNFSRYRVDQYAALGWKKLIPITLGWTLLLAVILKVLQMVGLWGGWS